MRAFSRLPKDDTQGNNMQYMELDKAFCTKMPSVRTALRLMLLSFWAWLPQMGYAASFNEVNLPQSGGPCAEGRVCEPPQGFSAEFVLTCKTLGGGDPCDASSLSLKAFHNVMKACSVRFGLELCLAQPCGDEKNLVCSVDLERFPKPLQKACLSETEQPAECYRSQLPKKLYRASLKRCRKDNGGDGASCLSEASKAWNPQGSIEVRRFRPEWKKVVIETLLSSVGTRLLAHSVDAMDPKSPAFCPRYESLTDSQRAEHWSGIVANIARWESDFDPESVNATDPGGGSWGLMQISPMVKTRLNLQACPTLQSGQDLLEPLVNLRCGIEVLGRQIEKRGRLFLDSDQRYYWRVVEVFGPNAIRAAVGEGYTRINSQMAPCFVEAPKEQRSFGQQ